MSSMGKVQIHIPLVTWRDGRPRFFASAVHRALGYKGEDLRHGPRDADGRPVGPWFSLDETIAWSAARQAELAERRRAIAAGETTARKTANGLQRARAAGLLTVSQLVEKFLDQPRMKGQAQVEGRKSRRPVKPNTLRYYRAAAAALERHNGGRVWHEAAAAVSSTALDGILDRVEVESGLAVARSVRALLSAAYGFGVRKGQVAQNPVERTETLPALAPRLRCGEPAEMAAFIKGCDALGFPDVADSVLLGLMSGQRQNDRLALTDGQVTAEGILFRQGKKHGQPLLIPVADPEWIARLAAMRARRRDWRVNYPHVLIDERKRRPWNEHDYRKVFRVLRTAIATGGLEAVAGRPTVMAKQLLGGVDIRARLAAAGVEVTPSLKDFRDQDLRDTAVTWLARAGCSKLEIAAITGHSLKSIDEILKHYLGLHPELARSAMAKMVAWRAGRG